MSILLRHGVRVFATVLVLASATLLAACGGEDDEGGPAARAPGAGHLLLETADELVVDLGGEIQATVSTELRDLVDAIGRAADDAPDLAPITVDYPLEGAVFPPDFVSPTFLWHDEAKGADTWLLRIRTGQGRASDLSVLVAASPPPEGEIDPDAIGDTNQVYEPTPYQASARSWTPSGAVWEAIKRLSKETPVVVSFVGFLSKNPDLPLSLGRLEIMTSKDPVGAPIFYRDVPLIPAVGETGLILPLARSAFPLIAWRLRDVSRPESRVLLTGMPSCANCHSFSRDGSTLGMDVDGPDGDKGMYALVPVTPEITISRSDVLTWNSFPDKPQDHKTIGFLSRVSPDGSWVVSTVNEELYVANFENYRFLQVFFPTRGILAAYSRKTGKIKALPGADDPKYVHCDAVWSPDGRELIFARARSMAPYVEGKPRARYANDPNEPQIHYDLYRIPFDEGRGGTPTAIEGASGNGMSNTFPKVSPDGKWIVFTKCDNGQLMRPDGKLWIVPFEGGRAREMRCNTSRMNSWHSFSPNGRWLVFSSKQNTPYTQMFLTHIDEDGGDSPPILVPDSTAANRAVNIPEFLNAPYDALQEIEIPAANHYAHFQRGLAFVRVNSFEKALPHLHAALAEEPLFARAHSTLGYAYHRLERPKEARTHYEKALEIDPRNHHALTDLGTLWMHQGDADRALDYWLQALAINPFDIMAHNNVGMVLGQRNLLERATHHFERALELNPDFTAAHKSLGTVWLRRGRGDVALDHFRKVLEHQPGDPYVRGAVASILMEQGRDREALDHLEKLVELRANDAHACTLLAWFLATSADDAVRDGARAVALAERACRVTGYTEPATLDALAAAYAETGRFAEASQTARRALGLVKSTDRDLADAIRERVRHYERQRPYRDRREGPRSR